MLSPLSIDDVSLLIVDDVHDSGLSIEKIIYDLKKACKKNTPEIRVATPYFKPKNNKTDRTPDYFIHDSDEWLVFPHELDGLTSDEIRQNRPQLVGIMDKVDEIKAR